MIYEVRGISHSYFDGITKTCIVVRDAQGDQYTTLDYPSGRPVTPNNVIIFLTDFLGVGQEDIVIPRHIKLE